MSPISIKKLGRDLNAPWAYKHGQNYTYPYKKRLTIARLEGELREDCCRNTEALFVD